MVDNDAQLLANRIKMLQNEEKKLMKKIEQTRRRADDIMRLKQQNEERYNEKMLKKQNHEENVDNQRQKNTMLSNQSKNIKQQVLNHIHNRRNQEYKEARKLTYDLDEQKRAFK